MIQTLWNESMPSNSSGSLRTKTEDILGNIEARPAKNYWEGYNQHKEVNTS